MAIEASMPNLSSASASRQKPTRLPYSCQVQFGMSGVGTPPAGGVFTVRGIGELMSHSSIETSTQTATRWPPGRARFGRRVIGEYAIRSIGNMSADILRASLALTLQRPVQHSVSISATELLSQAARVFVTRL